MKREVKKIVVVDGQRLCPTRLQFYPLSLVLEFFLAVVAVAKDSGGGGVAGIRNDRVGWINPGFSNDPYRFQKKGWKWGSRENEVHSYRVEWGKAFRIYGTFMKFHDSGVSWL